MLLRLVTPPPETPAHESVRHFATKLPFNRSEQGMLKRPRPFGAKIAPLEDLIYVRKSKPRVQLTVVARVPMIVKIELRPVQFKVKYSAARDALHFTNHSTYTVVRNVHQNT